MNAISSIGDPPSDQSECECRSPRSCARSSSPPFTSGPKAASSLASRSGISPLTASVITAAVLGPMPARSVSVPASARAATSSAGSGRITAAALRKAWIRRVSSRPRSIRNAIRRRAATGPPSYEPAISLELSSLHTRWTNAADIVAGQRPVRRPRAARCPQPRPLRGYLSTAPAPVRGGCPQSYPQVVHRRHAGRVDPLPGRHLALTADGAPSHRHDVRKGKASVVDLTGSPFSLPASRFVAEVIVP